MAHPGERAVPMRGRRRPLLGRWSVLSQLQRDVLLAGLLAVGSTALLLPVLGPAARSAGVELSTAQQAATVSLVVAQTLVLALRHLRPQTSLALVVLGQLALTAVLPDQTSVRLVAPLVAAYTLAVLLPVRRTVGWVLAAVLAESAGGYLVIAVLAPVVRPWLGAPPGDGPSEGLAAWLLSTFVVTLYYLAPALAGVLAVTRQDNLRLVRERAAAAVAEHTARTDLAAQSERSRMARELHDIAAHHLSGLVVQASAADRLIETDPVAARELVRSIRADGKQALGNLRLVVGVLRDSARPDGEEAGEGSSEAVLGLGLAAVDRLVAHAHRLGDDVILRVEGEPYPLGPVADVTVYRVLQESLTNARRHATGAPVRVTLRYHPDALRLEVVNGPGGPATERARPGFGLLGMRERAALAGARVDAEPTADHGWRVAFVLPIAPSYRGGAA